MTLRVENIKVGIIKLNNRTTITPTTRFCDIAANSLMITLKMLPVLAIGALPGIGLNHKLPKICFNRLILVIVLLSVLNCCFREGRMADVGVARVGCG